jgi:gliding motility-associated-like protein
MKRIVFLSILSLLAGRIWGQDDCPNIDLSQGNFNAWQCFTGWCCDISTPTIGMVPGRHTIMGGGGFAPWTCNTVPVIPPGYAFSARIGNDNTGAEAERISYTVDVTEQSTLLIYKYAVVLEDPGHSSFEQPRFLARVTDQNGNVITCTVYQVAASQNLPGFQSCGGVVYQNWTTVGVDVSDYLGQQVTLEFATGDCALGGHFGLAYVVAECRPLQLESRYCVGSDNVATIAAPDGFTYLWSTGETSQEIQITNPVEGQVVSCQITSVTGCQAYLESVMTPSSTIANFNPTVPCTADAFFDNVSTINNGTLASSFWEITDGLNNVITTSADTNFSYVFAQPGIYNVLLAVSNDAACIDSFTQQVVIRQSPEALYTEVDVCADIPLELTALSSIPDNTPIFNSWIPPDSLVVDGNLINLQFPDSGSYPVTLVTIAANGCTDAFEGVIDVLPNPEPAFALADFCENGESLIINSSETFSLAPVYSYSNVADGFSSSELTPLVTASGAGGQIMSLTITENHGTAQCTASVDEDYTVYPVPQAAFTGDTTGCHGNWMTFNDASVIADGTPLDHHWYRDGVLVSNSANYATPLDSGIYILKLKVRSLFGCEDSAEREIHIYPNPVVDLSVLPSGCPPFSPQEAVVVTEYWGNDLYYAWTVDSDTVSTMAAPAIQLDVSGAHTIGIGIMAGDNLQLCPGADQEGVFVFYLPQIATEVVYDCTGLTDITNLTTIAGGAVISGYNWTSDDGYVTDDTDFYHQFASVGQHSIVLEAFTSDGCMSSSDESLYIHPSPVASFFSDNPCAGEGLDVQATSTVSDGSELTHQWLLTATGEEFTGNSWNVVVPDPGMAEMSLISISAFNCPDTVIQSIEVYVDPTSLPVIPPVCQFDDIIVENQSLTTAQNVEYQWFLDGAAYSVETVPAFSSEASGTYLVTLAVEEIYPIGTCQDTLDIEMVIWPTPVPSIAGDTTICAMTEVSIESTTTISEEVFFAAEWSIDGTMVSTSPDLIYLMADSGIYELTLHEFTPHCESFLTNAIWVYPNPEIAVGPDTSFCPPGEVPMHIEVSSYWGDILSYATTLNGDSLFTESDPEFYFNQTGDILVESTVFVGDGMQQCSGTDQAFITVWPLPVADFTWTPERIYESYPVFTLLQQAIGFSLLRWSVNGEDVGTEDSTIVRLFNASPGEHTICLYVENVHGCSDSICYTLNLIDLINVHVPNAFTPDNDGLNEYFGPSIDNTELLDEYRLVILDRWGVEMFSSNDPNEKWKGDIGRSGQFVQNDVYIYRLTYSEIESTDSIEEVGIVTILR